MAFSLPGKHWKTHVCQENSQLQRCLQILGKLHGLRIFSGFLRSSIHVHRDWLPISVHDFHWFKMAGSHGCYGWVPSGNLTVCYWKCTIHCWFTHSKRWLSSSLCKRLPEGMDRPNRRTVCFTKRIFANGRFQGEFLGLDWNWLVVKKPSWKIWVRQWEGWHPIYELEVIKFMFETTNQKWSA